MLITNRIVIWFSKSHHDLITTCKNNYVPWNWLWSNSQGSSALFFRGNRNLNPLLINKDDLFLASMTLKYSSRLCVKNVLSSILKGKPARVGIFMCQLKTLFWLFLRVNWTRRKSSGFSRVSWCFWYPRAKCEEILGGKAKLIVIVARSAKKIFGDPGIEKRRIPAFPWYLSAYDPSALAWNGAINNFMSLQHHCRQHFHYFNWDSSGGGTGN